MGNSWYDTAQVCLNGHAVNDMVRAAPELSADFCDKCGAPTITTCPHCKAPIRGDYHVPGVFSIGTPYSPPAFCHACGLPYPWTEATLESARELTDELHGLTPQEREILKSSLDDLVSDTPRTALAATRFKKLVAQAGPVVAEAFKEILVGVVTETAKKMIWP
ncbi:MAG TPA: DUF2321 domain-containing protein [Chloroflexi bacterium]|nr:DUF2321 domain-containing protein [Chloroflexota bacterium]